MSPARYDAVVIGCGPGGSSAATLLARAGRRVLALEKEVFPRFHIGESLLPYNRAIFAELGVLPAIEAAGFPKKHGAQFHLGDGSQTTRFLFREGRFTREPMAIQVERAVFDHLLLKHTRACGAEVREGWSAQRFRVAAEGLTVEARGPTGTLEAFQTSFLIDASGRANLTGNQENLRLIHPRLKKVALFGHFTGVRLDAGEPGGDTVIVRLENKWFWVIPISAAKTSVGLVMDKEEFARDGSAPEEVLNRWIACSPPMSDRMRAACRVGDLQTTADFSYYNRRFVGPRLLRVGDAAGFMDPIFSAGVFLAMYSGKLAAQVVHDSLQRGSDGRRDLVAYEGRVRAAMRFYWRMVEQFYTTPFIELFMQPRNNLDLPSAVNAVLAGELAGGWGLRWRLRVFFLLVRLQALWPLVPRLRLKPDAGSGAPLP